VETGDKLEITSDNEKSHKIMKRIVIDDDNVVGESDGQKRMIEELESGNNVRVEILRKASDSTSDCMKKIFILENESQDSQGSSKRKVLIITKVSITELSGNDREAIKNAGIESKKPLKTDELVLFPNPGSGKFRLSFNLQEKGDAEIKIISIEGKTVYEEKLKQFAGKYEKEINIGESPKGVYFLSIAQGDKRELKKIVLE
jgi:hypothetical protein